jgi:hypothetical protein
LGGVSPARLEKDHPLVGNIDWYEASKGFKILEAHIASDPLYKIFIEEGIIDIRNIKAQDKKFRELCDFFGKKCRSYADLFVNCRAREMIGREKSRELFQLEDHLEELATESTSGISTRLKKVTSARYFLKVEPLPPEDVVFGNDGGCCIATSDEIPDNDSMFDESESVPYFQLDQGTVVIGLYQKIGKQKARRVGMSLAFVTIDRDEDAALAVNSYELSQATNPLSESELRRLIAHMNDYHHRFAEETGLQRNATATHGYNTARSYIDDDLLILPGEEVLTKLPSEDQCIFYSEIFDENNTTKQRKWSFVIADD